MSRDRDIKSSRVRNIFRIQRLADESPAIRADARFRPFFSLYKTCAMKNHPLFITSVAINPTGTVSEKRSRIRETENHAFERKKRKAFSSKLEKNMIVVERLRTMISNPMTSSFFRVILVKRKTL